MNNKMIVSILVVLVLVIGVILFVRNYSTEVEEMEEDALVQKDNIQNPNANLEENIINDNEEVKKEINMENTNNVKVVDKFLKITVLKQGSGTEAKAGDNVSVNYTGKLENGTIFDSNVLPEFRHVEPFVFPLGAGMVIKGWDIGVAGMKVGEKRILEIAPEYGYGATGAGGAIPPNAKLIFEVELLGINK